MPSAANLVIGCLLGACRLQQTAATLPPEAEGRTPAVVEINCPFGFEKVLNHRVYEMIFTMYDYTQVPVPTVTLEIATEKIISSDFFLPHIVESCKGQLCVNRATYVARGHFMEEDVKCVSP